MVFSCSKSGRKVGKVEGLRILRKENVELVAWGKELLTNLSRKIF